MSSDNRGLGNEPIVVAIGVIAGLINIYLFITEKVKPFALIPDLCRSLAVLCPSPTFTPTSSSTCTPTPSSTYTPTLAPIVSPSPTFIPILSSPKDGMTIIFVPKGEFLMGSSDAENDAHSDEKPQHNVYLDAFWIDKTEVTNAMYAVCVKDGSCEKPTSDDHRKSSYDNHPVRGVSWKQATVYCEWAGGRLPTEAEWEKAARGLDGNKYPWGNILPSCDLANYSGCAGDTKRVGSYPSGASPYGILDLAGNVWEWVNDWYGENYYTNNLATNPKGPDSGQYRVLRGSAWDDKDIGRIRAASRFSRDPKLRFNDVGFRCVRSP